MKHDLHVHIVKDVSEDKTFSFQFVLHYESKEEFYEKAKRDLIDLLYRNYIPGGVVRAVVDCSNDTLYYYNRTTSTKGRTIIIYTTPERSDYV